MNTKFQNKVPWFLPFLMLGLLPLMSQQSEVKSLYDITVSTIDGTNQSLSQYEGQTMLIINVASKCGLTPQYKELQLLFEKYKDRGFTILAFPANNFRNQEPGGNAEIKTFCQSNYNISFPLFSKISVAGDDIHPLYALLTNKITYPESGGPIRWNFDKFLVSANGLTIKRFDPKTKPLSADLTQAIEEMLKTTQTASQLRPPDTLKPPCCK